MKLLKILSAAFLLQSVVATAFEGDSCDHRWWLNVGLGLGTTFNNEAAPISSTGAGQVSFNGMITENIFVEFARTFVVKGSDRGPEATDAGILFGYKGKHPNWYWATSAGVSYYRYEKPYYYNFTVEKNGVGIPVEGQLFWKPFRHFGIGLIAHGLVSQDPYAVVLLGFQLS